MAGRNNPAIAATLEAMAPTMANQPNINENAGYRSLATFQRGNPLSFKGTYDPDGALTWLKEVERIFRVMESTPAQKVRYGTHMLAVEADDRWLETRQRLETIGEEVTWVVFCREFLRKYYPEDVRGKKEIEFLKLKQGNKLVTEYATKFVELAKFYPHYSEATAEFSKCIKFENGLRSEIKKAVGYQKICVFADLVNCCRIYEEDSNAYYKMLNDRRGKNQQNCGKPNDAPIGKGKQKVAQGQRTSGGDAPASVVCFKYGKPGHKSNVCNDEVKRGFRWGKSGYTAPECKHKEVTCFNCGEEGHISTQCHKPKKASGSGKVFVLAGTHKKMRMDLLECPLSIFDRDFDVDLVCLSLRGLDVILGMNWLKHNHVHINCYDNSWRFSTLEEEGVNLLFMRQLQQLMKEDVQVFSLMSSLCVENQAIIEELQMVREFPEVFPNEIPNVLPEREVEFAIDLYLVPDLFLWHRTRCDGIVVDPSKVDAVLQWETPK
ncbi:uncharacterized protein LOC131641940 [Vicia villosa]|uniref:uncharacterized protein LOC131641940 n=1 Tax=Vicia villosa TaxID=3911 RepID=UPI00273C2693|nr:uncharacterized protein LOC131641940 [Vicia villosa]